MEDALLKQNNQIIKLKEEIATILTNQELLSKELEQLPKDTSYSGANNLRIQLAEFRTRISSNQNALMSRDFLAAKNGKPIIVRRGRGAEQEGEDISRMMRNRLESKRFAEENEDLFDAMGRASDISKTAGFEHDYDKGSEFSKFDVSICDAQKYLADPKNLAVFESMKEKLEEEYQKMSSSDNEDSTDPQRLDIQRRIILLYEAAIKATQDSIKSESNSSTG